MTIFAKIIAREIPADIVYEDDRVLAFRDIQPVAPVHLLIIPKKPIPSLAEVEAEDTQLLGHILCIAKQLAEEQGIAEQGYRCVFNCREHGGQTVDHLHLHLIGGKAFGWPPYADSLKTPA